MGDRNFGVFSIAYVAQRAGHQVLLRLTDVRAHKLGERISRAGEYAVSWKPSRWDKAKQQPWPPEAAVQGRLMAYRIGRGKKKTWLYLFTDLNLPAEQIVELYARRWNIETDLRALKQTVRLQHLTAKTTDLMEKELGAAVSAYNLVRAVMVLAARRANLHPRQLSFTYVLNVVDTAWPRLLASETAEEHARELDKVLFYAAQCKLPQRRKRRAYPRLVWSRGYRFPTRSAEKTK
jgi:putative transposase